MPPEQELLLSVHSYASPALDRLFLASHYIGSGGVAAVLIVLVAGWHFYRGNRADAFLWLGLGVSTVVITMGTKIALARPRPELWPRLFEATSGSFPSGHSVIAATFPFLLARDASRRWPSVQIPSVVLAVFAMLVIGTGRVYFGVHWPTDVIGGWAVGAAQTLFALQLAKYERQMSPAPVLAG